MRHLILNKQRGLTLTELLAVLLIIGLLATVAVPVYVSRQEDARIRVAQGESREIAMAEEQVAIAHGFYVPFQMLDDLPYDPNRINPTPRIERIDQYPGAIATNLFLISPFTPAEEQFINQPQPSVDDGDPDRPTNPQVRNLIVEWRGPFISFHRFWYDVSNTSPYQGPNDPQYRTSDDMFRDFPLDPWGNPYRFYSPIGIIGNGSDHGTGINNPGFDFENPNPNFSNGELTRDDEDRFDRYAVVSYGRDGIRDTLLPINSQYNDIVYEFGTNGLAPNFGKY